MSYKLLCEGQDGFSEDFCACEPIEIAGGLVQEADVEQESQNGNGKNLQKAFLMVGIVLVVGMILIFFIVLGCKYIRRKSGVI